MIFLKICPSIFNYLGLLSNNYNFYSNFHKAFGFPDDPLIIKPVPNDLKSSSCGPNSINICPHIQ